MYNKIQDQDSQRHPSGSGIIFGIMLLAAGSLLLLNRLGFIPGHIINILLTWPMILIVVGLVTLYKSKSSASGLIILLVGAFFMLPKVFMLPYNFHHNFWPLILIIAGILLLFSRKKQCCRFTSRNETQITNENYFDVTAFMGGGERIVTSQNLEGGKVECFMGGAEVNLVNSSLSQGKNIIDVSIMFGGITFIIPADWTVHSDVNAILGGYSDNRTLMGAPSPAPDKTIYIRGSVMFGGCEVKSY